MVSASGHVPASFFYADFAGDFHGVFVLFGAASSRYMFAFPVIAGAGQGRYCEEKWPLLLVFGGWPYFAILR